MVQVSASAAAGSLEDSLDTVAAAAYIGCSPGYLIKLRGSGDGPPYLRLFKRKGIRYQRSEINRWRSERRFGSTSEYPETLP